MDDRARQEKERGAIPGILSILLIVIGVPILAFVLLGMGIRQSQAANSIVGGALIFGSIVVGITWFTLLGGFFIVEPNGSKVMVLFGKYQGTVKKDGFYWANPFMVKRALSLRARTLNGEKLKVNDAAGNPIEIAAIIVWKVDDTYRASFDVDNYEQFVRLQSETAVRHLASTHPYDAEEDKVSLRRHSDEVGDALRNELDERLSRAGIKVLEARLSHLAYAPEIAGAMLRRQQATAVISARQKIVEGAVGMVEMALHRLEEHETVKMNDGQKAQLVSNLLVVLCGEQAAQPVVSASAVQSPTAS